MPLSLKNSSSALEYDDEEEDGLFIISNNSYNNNSNNDNNKSNDDNNNDNDNNNNKSKSKSNNNKRIIQSESEDSDIFDDYESESSIDSEGSLCSTVRPRSFKNLSKSCSCFRNVKSAYRNPKTLISLFRDSVDVPINTPSSNETAIDACGRDNGSFFLND